MSLNLVSSNRMEILADTLGQVVFDTPLPAMEPETIVLQSRGMARWLAIRLAEKHGVWANVQCPFPNVFLGNIFAKILPEMDVAGHDKRIMGLQIMQLLPELLDVPVFAPLRNYLSSGRQLNRYQLAMQIADLFDQYTVFRPDMINKWRRGETESWQARLWHELKNRQGYAASLPDRAELLNLALEALSDQEMAPDILPQRINVFGISSIPPYHLKLFAGLAGHTEVNFFLLNPCVEYWGDIVSEHVADRLSLQAGREADHLHLETGNTLLASMGTTGKELFEMVQSLETEAVLEHFEPPPAADETKDIDLLALVQNDIYMLREDRRPDLDGTHMIGAGIQFHSCPSSMREVEILYDRLLEMFESNPALRPGDILVMTPNIEEYVPYIDAVFGGSRRAGSFIPYSVADRTLRSGNELIEVFFKVLSLADSRLSINRVMDIIESEPVSRTFGFSAADHHVMKRWLVDVDVRWGRDAEDKVRLGLPAFNANTWAQGIKRLLLGYAMASEDRQLFADLPPYEGMGGKQAELLGRLLDCLDKLFYFVEAAGRDVGFGPWGALLGEMVEGLLVGDPDDTGLQVIQEVLARMTSRAAEAGNPEEVSLEVVRTYLQTEMDRESFSSGFISGGVTFCEMLPMRAVPFKVVCMLGMNDGAYPRAVVNLSFDLMAASPRPGDRSLRNLDRFLFLEALISARRIFYISYVGQSIKDGSPLSPSVLVSELMDYLDRKFPNYPGPISRALTVIHPLQPFSAACFNPAAKHLFSYSSDNLRGALAAREEKAPEHLMIRELPDPSPEFMQLKLGDLLAFFRHPSQFVCRNRLRIRLGDDEEKLQESEPFALTGLTPYLMGMEMLDEVLSGGRADSLYPYYRAASMLPHGTPGRAAFDELTCRVAQMAECVQPYVNRHRLEPLEDIFRVGEFSLHGHVGAIWETGQIHYRFAAIQAKDMICAWICHLFYQVVRPEHYPDRTYLFGRDATLVFGPVADAGRELSALLDLYLQGLKGGLPFFPAVSWIYFETLRKKDRDAALAKARHSWNGDRFTRGAVEDPYLRLLFKESDPLDADFEQLAVQIFSPLVDVLLDTEDEA